MVQVRHQQQGLTVAAVIVGYVDHATANALAGPDQPTGPDLDAQRGEERFRGRVEA